MSITLAVVLGFFLVLVACALLLGAARSKVATVSGRLRTIFAGMVLLVSGFTSFWYAVQQDHSTSGVATAAVLVALFIGGFGGYWYGHTSGRHAA